MFFVSLHQESNMMTLRESLVIVSIILCRFAGSYKLFRVIPANHNLWRSYQSLQSAESAHETAQGKVFDWERQWYPIAVAQLLDKSRPHAVKLLGKSLVIWYDGKEWRVFDDSCPHRAVPLSEGRIEKDGQLHCAYHGWEFSGEGNCVRMPQADSPNKEQMLLQNERSCARVYPSRLEQGLIWCWGMSGYHGSDVAVEASLKSPHLIEDLVDPSVRDRIALCLYDVRDLPYGWDYFVENTIDPAHVVVSHHNRGGNRYIDPKPLNITRVASRSEVPREEGGEYDPAYPEDRGFKFISNPVNSKFDAYTSTDFRPPCMNKIDNVRKDGGKLTLAAYCIPTMPGYCRQILATIIVGKEGSNRLKGMGLYSSTIVPNWLSHLVSNLFIIQDMVFLHHQERKMMRIHKYAFGRFPAHLNMTSDPKAYFSSLFLPNNQDLPISTLRNWIHHTAGGGPVWGTEHAELPSASSSQELFNVYEMHTKHCMHCLKAVRNIKVLRVLLGVVGAVWTWSLRTKKTSLALLPAAVASAAVFGLNLLLKRFYVFEFNHQDNH